MAEADKKALVAQLASQRAMMTTSRQSLQAELSISTQLKKSVQNKPTHWVIGGAVSAIVLYSLFRRKKVIYTGARRKRGIIGRSARFALLFIRPAITRYAVKRARVYAEDQLRPLVSNSMLGDPPQK